MFLTEEKRLSNGATQKMFPAGSTATEFYGFRKLGTTFPWRAVGLLHGSFTSNVVRMFVITSFTALSLLFSRIKPAVWPTLPNHKKTLDKLCHKLRKVGAFASSHCRILETSTIKSLAVLCGGMGVGVDFLPLSVFFLVKIALSLLAIFLKNKIYIPLN